MKLLLFFLYFLSTIILNAQLTYIPDDGFEQYLETNYPSVDNGIVNDNYILSSGIPNVISIQLSGSFGNNVNDFTGIENLTSLFDIQMNTLTITTVDLSQIVNNLSGPNGYFRVKINNCNNLTSILLPPGNIQIQIKENPILQNIQFQGSNVFYSINAIQTNNTISSIDFSNTAGVYPGASLWVTGNLNLQCLKINNGQCSNWNGVQNMPNGITDASNPYGSLHCVQVDNPSYSEVAQNWSFSSSGVPNTYYYSANCNCLTETDELSLENLIIYPNPSEENFFIKGLSGKIEISEIDLLDLSGNNIKSIDINKNQFSMSEFKSGLYFLRISSLSETITLILIKK